MKHAIVLALILLAACVPVAETPAPVAQEPVQETAPEAPEPVVPDTPIEQTEPEGFRNPDVVVLSEKASTVKSYTFQLAELPEISGGRTYYVRGDKAKVRLVTPVKMDGFSADYIFLDYTRNSAVAYCIELHGCRDKKLTEGVSFNEYATILPLDWLDEAQYGEKRTQVQYNSRPVTVVQWEAEGRYYEAYLDNYYGMPQRVSIAMDAERTNIVGGQEYQSMAFNTVKEEDVLPPY